MSVVGTTVIAVRCVVTVGAKVGFFSYFPSRKLNQKQKLPTRYFEKTKIKQRKKNNPTKNKLGFFKKKKKKIRKEKKLLQCRC